MFHSVLQQPDLFLIHYLSPVYGTHWPGSLYLYMCCICPIYKIAVHLNAIQYDLYAAAVIVGFDRNASRTLSEVVPGFDYQ